ncbi:MAG TPA: hypothetical protein VMM84_11825 [Pyrinomonadaceae bacterium]|nr:hypothetical protein [Pyrinomonadaceae bacterium]
MKSRIEAAILTCIVLSLGLVLPVVYKATTQDQNSDAAESTPKKQGQEPGALWSLNYGIDPFKYSTAEAVPDSPIKPVLPSDAVEISLSEDGFHNLVSFLKSANYFSGTNKVELRIGKIGFSDGTLWMTGRFFMRDSTSSWGWRHIDSPSAKRKSDQTELVL